MKRISLLLAFLTFATHVHGQDRSVSAEERPTNFFDTAYDAAIGYEGNYLGFFPGVPGAHGPVRITLTRGGSYVTPTRNSLYQWVRDPKATWHASGHAADGRSVFGVLGLGAEGYQGSLKVRPGAIEFHFRAGGANSGFERVKVQLSGKLGGDLQGNWSTEEASGRVSWQRVHATPRELRAKIIERSSDGPVVLVAKPGERLLVDLGRWYERATIDRLFSPETHDKMRGNRPNIHIQLMGEGYWGRQYAWISPRSGFEMPKTQPIIVTDAAGAQKVVGLNVVLTMWQDLKPGLHRLVVNGKPIEFELRMPGRLSEEQQKLRPQLQTLVLREGVYVPLEGKLGRQDIFKIRATYGSMPGTAGQWLEAHNTTVGGVDMKALGDGLVWESEPLGFWLPSPKSSPPPVLEEPSYSRASIIWSTSGEVHTKPLVEPRHRFDADDLQELRFTLRGTEMQVPLADPGASTIVHLGIDSMINDYGTPKERAGFVIMQVAYDESALNESQKKALETAIETLEVELPSYTPKLSDAERAELRSVGFVVMDLKAQLTKPAQFHTSEEELLVMVLDRGAGAPRDLYAHGKALERVQENFRNHISGIRTKQRQLEAAQAETQKVMGSDAKLMVLLREAILAHERTASALPRAETSLPPLPVADEHQAAKLAEMKKRLGELKIYVVLDGMRTSTTPKGGYSDAEDELARVERAYDGIHENLKNDYAAGKGSFRSPKDIVNAPELKRLEKRAEWLRGMLAGIRAEREVLAAQVQSIEKARKEREESHAKALLRAKAAIKRDDQRFQSEQRILISILKLAGEKASSSPPDLTDVDGRRDTEIVLQRVEHWCHARHEEAQSRIEAAKASSAKAYRAWHTAKEALPQHTAYLIEVQSGVAQAINNAYRTLEDRGPYEEFLKEVSNYGKVLSYAKTFMLMPTKKNYELLTKGGIEAGYDQKLTAMGVKMGADSLKSFFLSDMFPSLRLAGTHLQQQGTSAMPLNQLRHAVRQTSGIGSERTVPGIRQYRSYAQRLGGGYNALNTSGQIYGLGSTLISAADSWDKGDPTATFKTMGSVMSAMDLLQRSPRAGVFIKGVGVRGFDFSYFKLPIRGSLLSLHLSILAQAGTEIVKAGDRIADSKVEELLRHTLSKPPERKLYSYAELASENVYKEYARNKDATLERLATLYQLKFITREMARNPLKQAASR